MWGRKDKKDKKDRKRGGGGGGGAKGGLPIMGFGMPPGKGGGREREREVR